MHSMRIFRNGRVKQFVENRIAEFKSASTQVSQMREPGASSTVQFLSEDMTFRIAIGRCDCSPPYRNRVEALVCKAIHETLADWRTRLPDDLATIPSTLFEERIVEGCRVTFGTYKVNASADELLIVCQAFVHTWSRPTYFSIGAVGRVYAEGLLITNGSKVESAADNLMWQFR